MLIQYPAEAKLRSCCFMYNRYLTGKPRQKPKSLKYSLPDSSFSVSSDWIAASDLEMLKSGGGIERIGAGVNWLKEIDEAMLNQDL